MQSLPFSKDLPLTIKNHLLSHNGIHKHRINSKILNGFIDDNYNQNATNNLMDIKERSSKSIYNSTLDDYNKSSGKSQFLTKDEVSNPESTFNLTEFIANRIEKSLQEECINPNSTYSNAIISHDIQTSSQSINNTSLACINNFSSPTEKEDLEKLTFHGTSLKNAQTTAKDKFFDIQLSSCIDNTFGKCSYSFPNPNMQYNMINNNRITKVMAKTIFPSDILASSKHDNSYATMCANNIDLNMSPLPIDTYKQISHQPTQNIIKTFESHDELINLHCSEQMDDVQVSKHEEMNLFIGNTSGQANLSNNSTLPPSPIIQKKLFGKHHYQNATFKFANNDGIPPKSTNVDIPGTHFLNHKEGMNLKEICTASTTHTPVSNNVGNRYNVLSLPQKNLNTISTTGEEALKRPQPRVFVSTHSFRATPGIVGINAKEFQHLIFMNHKSQQFLNTGTDLHPNTAPSQPLNSTLISPVSSLNIPNHVINKGLNPLPINPAGLAGFPMHKHTHAPSTVGEGQGPKIILGSNNYNRYANSTYNNYLSSPPHTPLTNCNNAGGLSQNALALGSIKNFSSQQLLTPHTPVMISNINDQKVPYSFITPLKPTSTNTLDYPQLISTNIYPCTLPKSPFYHRPPSFTPMAHVDKAHSSSGRTLLPNSNATNLLKSPLSIHLALSPSSHMSVSPRKKQPRKQNLTINKRGHENDLYSFAQCLELDTPYAAPDDPNSVGFSPKRFLPFKSQLENHTSDKYAIKKQKMNELRLGTKNNKDNNHTSFSPALKRLKDKKSCASLLNDPPKSSAMPNGPYTKVWKNNRGSKRAANPNPPSPFDPLLGCATTVLSPDDAQDESGTRIGAHKILAGSSVIFKDRPAKSGDKDPAPTEVRNARVKGKRERNTRKKRHFESIDPRSEDNKADELKSFFSKEDEPDDLTPKFYEDDYGVRWKIISEYPSAPPKIPRIIDNNSFYQNYKSGTFAPYHHFVRPEDVKLKDTFNSNNLYGALELAITNYTLTNPSLADNKFESCYPSSGLGSLLPEVSNTGKCKGDPGSKTTSHTTWKISHLANHLDDIISGEIQNINYLRQFRDSLYAKRIAEKIWASKKFDQDATSQNYDPTVPSSLPNQKNRSRTEYFNFFIHCQNDPDVKLYESIMASLQRSLFIKNELLESRKILLTTFATDFQRLLQTGIHNLTQLNNSTLSSRLTSSSSSGPLNNFFSSIAKKIKR